MKRIVASLLVISIVSGIFHFDELTKVTYLHKHFHEYNSSCNAISFTDYLLSHYIFDKESGDSADHSKLPFKSENCSHQHISVFVHSDISGISFHLNPVSFLFPETTPVLSVGDFSIFQPPRLI